MAYKVIPAAIAKSVDRNWTRSFLVWLDGVLATLGGLLGPGAFPPVRLITAGALATYVYDPVAMTITFSAAASQSVDGVATVLGDRIWNNNGAAASDQGLYTVTTKGTGSVAEVWTRAQDANASGEFDPGKILTSGPEGTANANALFELGNNATFVLDTGTPTLVAPINLLGKSGNLAGLASAGTSRTNLGIQSGVTTIDGATGKSPAIVATITASSRILVTLKNPANGALTVKFAALVGDRVVGAPGSFKVAALVAAGTVNTADTSDVDWLVIG